MIPTRVSYLHCGRLATRIFPSEEKAKEFGATVQEPEYQPATEPFTREGMRSKDTANARSSFMPKVVQTKTSSCSCGCPKYVWEDLCSTCALSHREIQDGRQRRGSIHTGRRKSSKQSTFAG